MTAVVPGAVGAWTAAPSAAGRRTRARSISRRQGELAPRFRSSRDQKVSRVGTPSVARPVSSRIVGFKAGREEEPQAPRVWQEASVWRGRDPSVRLAGCKILQGYWGYLSQSFCFWPRGSSTSLNLWSARFTKLLKPSVCMRNSRMATCWVHAQAGLGERDLHALLTENRTDSLFFRQSTAR